ncbi:TAXI family TRAP transporter solute-binding subunit [Biomaibacter acetigenes]|uniref:TAXI family TRAP transporter solute-binding subunit n=1 Tax=Biomaibacter acetigenes TaxID=2316383 RepID=A0A3G2R6J7_9FIRM|nr:TAXI family TRAP transporter solute-binding subunit [Biomaibacter acetigenes]AYO31080.1 TAXI family TRAP transporter solute-binding subunit [Biomaibacter acetigenes]
MIKVHKTIALILLILMIVSVTGCGNKNQQTNDTTTSAPSTTESSASADKAGEPVRLVWATDSVGSNSYTIVSAMATMLKDYLPDGSSIDVQPISPGGMGAPYLFESKTADIAFANGAPAKAAWNEGTLGKPPTQSYRAIAGHLTNVAAVTYFSTAFCKKYGVTTLEEVVAKKIPIRIGTSPKGSMDEWCASLALKSLGVTYDDIKKWGGDVIQAGGSQLSDMLKDGKIDMIMNHTSAQSSDVTQDAMTNDVTFVQFGEDMLTFFESQGFERITYKKGTWKGMDKDIVWPGTPDCVFVSKDMPDDVAYALTKGLCEIKDVISNQFSSLTPFDPTTAWMPEKVGGVPLHPGAEKYYKEVGYMK